MTTPLENKGRDFKCSRCGKKHSGKEFKNFGYKYEEITCSCGNKIYR